MLSLFFTSNPFLGLRPSHFFVSPSIDFFYLFSSFSETTTKKQTVKPLESVSYPLSYTLEMSDLRCPCGKRGSVGLKANVERHMKKCKYMKQTGTQPSRVQAQTDTEIELIAAKQRIVDLLTENSTLKTENITLKRHGANVNITNNNTNPNQHHALPVRECRWERENYKRSTSSFAIPRPPNSESWYRYGDTRRWSFVA